MLAANEIQRAIYARLAASLPVPVYDHVPQDAALPYVVIGADTGIPWDTKGADGQQFTCTIHCWDSPRAGRKSVKRMMELIYTALHHKEAELDLIGHALTELRCEFSESFQEAGYDGDADHYYHGVLRFRALVETL